MFTPSVGVEHFLVNVNKGMRTSKVGASYVRVMCIYMGGTSWNRSSTE